MGFTAFSNPDKFLESGTGAPTPAPSTPAPTQISTPETPPKPATPAPAPSVTKPPTTAGAGKCGTGTLPIKEDIVQTCTKAQYDAILMEYMDMQDYETVSQCMSLNEAEQNTLLVSLTNKLYKMIIDKIDDIEFGDIEKTKGDISKFHKYKQLRECIEVLKDIFIQYHEKITCVQEIDNALSNLENNKDLFMASYAGDIALGKMLYNNAALGVINALGFMIAVCIEYVKSPKKEGLEIVLNKTGIARVKDYIVYENLVKFNTACKDGSLEKAIRPLIKHRVKNFADGVSAVLFAVHATIAIGVIITVIIPLIRELVYFFFALRTRMSTYLDIQADLIEMNADELKSNANIKTVGDKDSVIKRQMRIARTFHDLAEKIRVDTKGAEVAATRDIKADQKKYKLDDVNANPANDGVAEPMF